MHARAPRAVSIQITKFRLHQYQNLIADAFKRAMDTAMTCHGGFELV
jgi:hypothetical protein